MGAFDFSALYTGMPHSGLLDVLYGDVGFMFGEGTRDYIIINKQGCASWSSKK